jgi:hypothetical protein
MKELYAYVEQKNAWGKLFGSEPLSLGRTEDRQRIADALDSDLSPENLTCDGELSRSQVQQKYTRLSRAARQLQDLDPAVKFYEFG